MEQALCLQHISSSGPAETALSTRTKTPTSFSLCAGMNNAEGSREISALPPDFTENQAKSKKKELLPIRCLTVPSAQLSPKTAASRCALTATLSAPEVGRGDGDAVALKAIHLWGKHATCPIQKPYTPHIYISSQLAQLLLFFQLALPHFLHISQFLISS